MPLRIRITFYVFMLLKNFHDRAEVILHKRQTPQHRGNCQKYRDHKLRTERVCFQYSVRHERFQKSRCAFDSSSVFYHRKMHYIKPSPQLNDLVLPQSLLGFLMQLKELLVQTGIVDKQQTLILILASFSS